MAGRRASAGILVAAILLAAKVAGGAQTSRPPAGRAAAAGDPVGAEAHLELGKMYHGQVFDALKLAIKEYEDAVRLQPDDGEAHYYLGLAYHSKAKLESDDWDLYTKALQQYRLYLRYSPNGELAPKATLNIRAVEAKLREQGAAPAGAAKPPRKAGGQR